MSMEYIRNTYQVPAKRGVRVVVDGRAGVIVGSRGAYIKVLFDGMKKSSCCHPTWEVEYKGSTDE